jgi:hypothetical protein
MKRLVKSQSPPVTLSDAAQNMIQRLIVESRWPDSSWPQAGWVHFHAKRLAALPVGLDLWSWWFLTSGGEAVLVEEGCDVEHARHTERAKVITAMVWASEKYQELRDVLPAREPGAVDCQCANIQRQASRTFLCPYCGGLGWLPRL